MRHEEITHGRPMRRPTGVSTAELVELLGRPEVVLVDAREPAAYNGWRLRGEARGGHIRGAVSLPRSWLDLLGARRLRARLEAKDITPDRTVVVYGAGGDDNSAVAQAIREVGGNHVLEYDAGWSAWAEDETLPLDRLPRYKRLVHPQWLHGALQGETTEECEGKSPILFEVGSGGVAQYRQGHVPGAVYLDTTEIEAGPLWNRIPDGDLEAVLPPYGIARGSLVVLYGRDTSAAARAAAILMYAGVDDVRLLDGGIRAWIAAGHELESGVRCPVGVGSFGCKIPAHPEYIIDLAEARAVIAACDASLVDVRSWAEYLGKTSGYSYIERRGRIAGAVWGRPGLLPHRLDQLRNVDGTMRSYHEIEANWQACGVTPDQRVVFYCGTGWRASEAFFYAYLMGWPDIAVYDGGWHEWSADPANPISLGNVSR